MVKVTIDGNSIEVPEGTTVLQAARMAGATIPTLCDHPQLIPYGGCRLCLVEVEGARTLQPSCTLPASNNMVVKTSTEKVKEARKFVLTLIFSERNHFCMYCQKSGGDCELQNCAYAEGMDHWPLQPNWQPYPVDASHPHMVMDHNRCILCRRCVRACGELVGNFTLGIEERGANSFLVADLGNPWGKSTCVSCGTCAQICPTGSLIDRKSAYIGHDAQSEKTQSICLGCSMGCGTEVVTRDNQILRIDGNWDAAVNHGVLCEAGRFLPLTDGRERVATPMVRKNGSLKAATWDEALDVLAERLTPLKGKNDDGIAALASTRLPAEALYAFKQVFAGALESKAVASLEDNTLAELTTGLTREFGRPVEGSVNALDAADVILAAGTDLTKEHQVAGFFIKRNVPRGMKLITVDTQENGLDAYAELALKPKKDTESVLLQDLASAVSALKNGASFDLTAAAEKTGIAVGTLQAAASILADATKPAVVFGKGIVGKNGKTTLKALVDLATAAGALSESHSSVVSVKGQANSLAAAQLGLNVSAELKGHQAVYLALGDEQPSQRLIKDVEGVPFLAVQASYVSPLTAKADVVLPVKTWNELEGHYLSLDGRLQAAHPATKAPQGIWSSAKVMDGLAARLGFTTQVDWKQQLTEQVPVTAIHEA